MPSWTSFIPLLIPFNDRFLSLINPDSYATTLNDNNDKNREWAEDFEFWMGGEPAHCSSMASFYVRRVAPLMGLEGFGEFGPPRAPRLNQDCLA